MRRIPQRFVFDRSEPFGIRDVSIPVSFRLYLPFERARLSSRSFLTRMITISMNATIGEKNALGLEILRWYMEAGVDIAIDEVPHDRLAEGGGEAQKVYAYQSG